MAEQPDHSWRQTLTRRLFVASGAFLLWSVAIEARLVYLQVIAHDAMVAEANIQQSDVVELPPKRGDILDRDGNPMASSVDADSAFAVPREVTNPARMLDALCVALGDCSRRERDEYIRRMTRRDKRGRLKDFAWLRRRMTPAQFERVAALELKGVYFRHEPRRYYPNRELAAHLLGWVGVDNTGLAGIEERYDSQIGGEAGEALIQVDGNGRPFNRLEKLPTAGATVVLTVDRLIQHIVERELADGVKRTGAVGGSAIVLDPHSGEILAMANHPTFNPNNVSTSKPAHRINRSTQNVYEPGSTFKIVTAGAALEEQIASPSDLIHTGPGFIRFGSRVINEAKGHNYGTLTFEDVIVKSSNVGAIKIGLELGAERLSSYVSRFGFGARASRDFAGESRGRVYDAPSLTPGGVASVSMGYQVSVTALQMAAAVSVVANGGELIQPRLLKGVIRDGVYTPEPRTVVRRVISEGAAKQLTAIMEGVVARGTAKVAQVEGFTIAGKTGTAAKTLPGGGYSTTDYNVSFAGFVPSRDPMFTILVVVDTPTKVSPYGGTVSAPIFQKIAAAVLRYRGVPASLNRPAPLLIARRNRHQQQVSAPPRPEVVTVAASSSDAPAVFPDLAGMSARDAVQTLVRLGFSARVHGAGAVVNQQPAAGSPLDLAGAATLWLDRRPRPDASPGEGQPRTLDAAGVSRGRP